MDVLFLCELQNSWILFFNFSRRIKEDFNIKEYFCLKSVPGTWWPLRDSPGSPPCCACDSWGQGRELCIFCMMLKSFGVGWSVRIVWELHRVRRMLQEHGGVSAQRGKKSWKVMQKAKDGLWMLFYPRHSGGGWEGKEIRKAAYHELKTAVTFYSSWRSPPQCLYSFHVVLSELFAGVYYRVPPDSKQPAILWPTSWVLQPSLSCAIWGIYSVTHHWESRGLPLYSKHYATIIVRKLDKWQAFLPRKCHKPLPLQMTWASQVTMLMAPWVSGYWWCCYHADRLKAVPGRYMEQYMEGKSKYTAD